MSTSLVKRRSYRRRTERSICRKKTGKKCMRLKGCKQTRKTMKRKSYCRKLKKHVVTGGGENALTPEEQKNKDAVLEKLQKIAKDYDTAAAAKDKEARQKVSTKYDYEEEEEEEQNIPLPFSGLMAKFDSPNKDHQAITNKYNLYTSKVSTPKVSTQSDTIVTTHKIHLSITPKKSSPVRYIIYLHPNSYSVKQAYINWGGVVYEYCNECNNNPMYFVPTPTPDPNPSK